MGNPAFFGLIGVLVGSLITAFGVVYRERLTNAREREARTDAEARTRRNELLAFQRESLVALQDDPRSGQYASRTPRNAMRSWTIWSGASTN
ncbi:hypothetical protein AB0J83_04645 [Actinoplanes sp. NPDC049596]|uniref:hypothetical protein n=1 Tax=unclassified Actinoplanes TaxID=2626549 RepID=UPI003431DF08